MAATFFPPRLLPSGDSAITVEFSRIIDDTANQRVLALDRALQEAPIQGVTEAVPTYRSLLVHYDPTQIDFATLGEKLRAAAERPVSSEAKARRWRFPVAYGAENGIDLEDVAKALDTTPDDIVARHVAGQYRVAMIGFTPRLVLSQRSGKIPPYAAPGESAPADAGWNHLGWRRADRHPMSRRPERLASFGPHAGANLSIASRPHRPAGAWRPRDALCDRRQNLRRPGSRRGGG